MSSHQPASARMIVPSSTMTITITDQRPRIATLVMKTTSSTTTMKTTP
jgi:hypothetical protein